MKLLMKIITVTGCICCSFLVNAQEVVSTQGATYSNVSGSLDFTIGEVLINTETNGSYNITQGFHQTNWNFLGLEDHVPEYEAIIYPNPILDVLNIKTNSFMGVAYSIYDAQGKLVTQNKLSADFTSIQVKHLAPGSYSVILNNESQKLKTFKLIKSH